MAGGIGSRFWPASRSGFPKQFLDILNTGKTLIQMTYERFLPICPKENIYIVTNEAYAELVKEQLPDLSDEQIVLEPSRRNTAPCIAYVSNKILQKDVTANMIVSPADHLILQENVFQQVLKTGLEFTEKNESLLTLGIKPTRPDTGYGYIQYKDAGSEQSTYRVKTFTEKPTVDIAKKFIESGDFLWNSGMFIWSVKSILKAFMRHLPEISEAFRGYETAVEEGRETAYIKEAYGLCTNISIDFGIMEKADNVFVIPSAFGWSDVGTWASLYDLYEKDYLNNAGRGKQIKVYDASGNMISASDDKLVVLQGLENYCVIDTDDVLLIFQKDKEQEVKKITTDLKRQKLDRYL